jgi:nucleotide-binding universal stress UspA family protein
MERTRWLVVGTDFSDAAAHALKFAVDVAAQIGAKVACVHAYEDAPGPPARYDPGPALRAQLEQAISNCLAPTRGVCVEPIVRRGAPWDKLTNVATDLGAELIVVGVSGQRRPPHQFFLGTVATRVAATSRRPVLVVPSLDELQPAPVST